MYIFIQVVFLDKLQKQQLRVNEVSKQSSEMIVNKHY